MEGIKQSLKNDKYFTWLIKLLTFFKIVYFSIAVNLHHKEFYTSKMMFGEMRNYWITSVPYLVNFQNASLMAAPVSERCLSDKSI